MLLLSKNTSTLVAASCVMPEDGLCATLGPNLEFDLNLDGNRFV